MKLLIMKKTINLLKVIPLLIFLPFEISKGSKKRTFKKIKETIFSLNLF